MANNSSSVVLPYTKPDICFMTIPDVDPHNMIRPDSVDSTQTFLVAVNGLAAPPTMVINALVIWAVVGDESLRSSSFNILLVSLAVSDFLVGLVVEPLYCVLYVCLQNNCRFPDCAFTSSALSLFVCGGSTLVSFAITSIERYLAIEHPNFYLKNITTKKVVTTTAIAWIIIIGFWLISSALLNKSYPYLFKVPSAIATITLCLVIFYCSARVHLTAYRQRRTIALQQTSVQEPNEQPEQEQRLQEYKRVFTITMLLGFSMLLYIPFIVVVVLEVVMDIKVDLPIEFPYIAMPICLTFIHFQSLINPILVALRLSYIRQRIKNMLASFVQAVQGN